jgi:uncharacterized membrane protein
METLTSTEFNGAMELLTFAVALGAATVGGVFFAFSTFVMRGLRALSDEQGLVAMQEVNRAAPSPLFMVALLGTAVASIGLAASALTRLHEVVARYELAGVVLYLAGVVLTMAYHVPRNDALDRVPTAGAGVAWPTYAARWTAWNHVRTLTSLAGAASLVFALRIG